MRKLKEDVKQEEERILFLDKFEKNEITEEETEAELQRLQAEVERRGSNASQGQLPHGSGGRQVGQCGTGKSDVSCRAFARDALPEQMPRKEGEHRNPVTGRVQWSPSSDSLC